MSCLKFSIHVSITGIVSNTQLAFTIAKQALQCSVEYELFLNKALFWGIPSIEITLQDKFVGKKTYP